jgi:hypothetical protein
MFMTKIIEFWNMLGIVTVVVYFQLIGNSNLQLDEPYPQLNSQQLYSS